MTIQIIDSRRSYEAKILFAFKEEIDRTYRNRYPAILAQVRNVITKALRASPEIVSLRQGVLQADFGLYSDYAVSATEEIIEHVVNRVNVFFISSAANLVYSLYLEVLPADVMPDIAKKYEYDSNGYSIPWAEWLLFEGTKVVVDDHQVFYRDGAGRSQKAIMNKGGFFRVDPEFSGTEEDNFIVRAIRSTKDDIINILRLNLGT